MSIIFDGSNGEKFPNWSPATRPSAPNTGEVGWNTAIGLEVWNGTQWNPLTVAPTYTATYVIVAGGAGGGGNWGGGGGAGGYLTGTLTLTSGTVYTTVVGSGGGGGANGTTG